MEYGQKLTLEDINCPHCGGQITGEPKCKHCQEDVIYGEAKAQLLEREGYSVSPTHRTEESFKKWYVENARSNSKLYKTGQGLTNVGKGVQEGAKAVNHFANALLWSSVLIIGGLLLLLLL